MRELLKSSRTEFLARRSEKNLRGEKIFARRPLLAHDDTPRGPKASRRVGGDSSVKVLFRRVRGALSEDRVQAPDAGAY